MHRQTFDRRMILELVQHEPSLVSEGIGGMNLMTLVFVIFFDEPA
jgi:hypothetical protein